MRKIDLSNLDRALHYQIFRNSLNPQYCVTFELNITHFLEAIPKQGYSFTFSFVFAVSKCANQIKDFPYDFFRGIRASLHWIFITAVFFLYIFRQIYRGNTWFPCPGNRKGFLYDHCQIERAYPSAAWINPCSCRGKITSMSFSP